MATATQLINAVSNALGVPRPTVRRYARSLREAGLFPTGKGGKHGCNAAEVEIEHAATLLLALGSTSVAYNAAASAITYGALPAVQIRLSFWGPEGLCTSGNYFVEDLSVPPGVGKFLMPLYRSLHSALTTGIENCANPDAFLPTRIDFIRGAAGPHVALTIPNLPARVLIAQDRLPQPSEAMIIFGPSGWDMAADIAIRRMYVAALMPGSALLTVGELFRRPGGEEPATVAHEATHAWEGRG